MEKNIGVKGETAMWGIWQVRERIWTSWNRFAAWKTKEIADKNMKELQQAYPGIQFEVCEYQ
jgi:hypothetical protein